MPLCKDPIFSSQLLWSLWGPWKKRLCQFWLSWVTRSQHCLEIVVGLPFCFNGFLFLCCSVLNSLLLRESFVADISRRKMTYRVIQLA